VLKEHAAGLSAGDLSRQHGISDATFYKWRSRYGGVEIFDARKLKALEDEMSIASATTSSTGRSRRQHLQPPRLRYIEPTILGLPLVERRAAHAIFATDVAGLR
jgi:putative transposase